MVHKGSGLEEYSHHEKRVTNVRYVHSHLHLSRRPHNTQTQYIDRPLHVYCSTGVIMGQPAVYGLHA